MFIKNLQNSIFPNVTFYHLKIHQFFYNYILDDYRQYFKFIEFFINHN